MEKAEKTGWSGKKFQGQHKANFGGHDLAGWVNRPGKEDNSPQQAGLRAPSGKRPA